MLEENLGTAGNGLRPVGTAAGVEPMVGGGGRILPGGVVLGGPGGPGKVVLLLVGSVVGLTVVVVVVVVVVELVELVLDVDDVVEVLDIVDRIEVIVWSLSFGSLLLS